MKILQGKVAIITGGTRGIGKAIAIQMARQGAKVVITYNSDKEKGIKTINEIVELGGEAILLKLSVESAEDSRKLAKDVVKMFGKIDILINNVGITKDSSFLMMSKSSWEKVIDVNLNGTFNCCKAVIPHMISKRSGNIVNITSISGLKGIAGQTNYSATKAAIVGFTKSLAQEVGKLGINVNAVAPGFIETDMTKDFKDEMRKKYLDSIPLGRFGEAEDVANLVTFLSSDYCKYILGQVIAIDGGLTS